jgi:hypothetical protein
VLAVEGAGGLVLLCRSSPIAEVPEGHSQRAPQAGLDEGLVCLRPEIAWPARQYALIPRLVTFRRTGQSLNSDRRDGSRSPCVPERSALGGSRGLATSASSPLCCCSLTLTVRPRRMITSTAARSASDGRAFRTSPKSGSDWDLPSCSAWVQALRDAVHAARGRGCGPKSSVLSASKN